MSKSVFWIWLAMLATMLLYSLSPLAPYGGMIVVFILAIPAIALLAVMGGNEPGLIAEHGFEVMLLVVGVMIALFALFHFYLAADRAQKGLPGESRLLTAVGLTIITVPAVMFFCYQSLRF